MSDNFFKLGGDSIIAKRLVAIARTADIHVYIFGHPALLDLSMALSIPERLGQSIEQYDHLKLSFL